MKAGAGHPMGPLTLSDFVGLDTLGAICDVMFDEFRERRFAQPADAAQDARRGLVRPQVGHGLLRLLRRGAGREPRGVGAACWTRSRPHPHRGDLIAAGAVVLTVGVLLDDDADERRLGRGRAPGRHRRWPARSCWRWGCSRRWRGSARGRTRRCCSMAGLTLLAVALVRARAGARRRRLAAAPATADLDGARARRVTAGWLRAHPQLGDLHADRARRGRGARCWRSSTGPSSPSGSATRSAGSCCSLMAVYVFASLREREVRPRHAVRAGRRRRAGGARDRGDAIALLRRCSGIVARRGRAGSSCCSAPAAA